MNACDVVRISDWTRYHEWANCLITITGRTEGELSTPPKYLTWHVYERGLNESANALRLGYWC